MNGTKYPTIEDMAGMGDATAAWHCLRDISGQASGGSAAEPSNIAVHGNVFVLSQGTPLPDAEQVTRLAESVYLLLMGYRHVKVLFSKDADDNVSESPRVPPNTYGTELSSLLTRMLDPDGAKRPDLAEVHDMADGMCRKLDSQRCERIKKQDRRVDIQGFWPEVMRSVMLLLIFLFTVQTSFSQIRISEEMDSLIQRAIDLRSDRPSAMQAFARDSLWTVMDELDESDGECMEEDKVDTHGFNNRAVNIFVSRSKVIMNAAGKFCSGEDPKYNYSIIELTVKKDSCVSYTLEKRKGKQAIAVVPYSDSIGFEAKVNNAQGIPFGSGITLFQLDYVSDTSAIEVSVRNVSGRNASFILINHNSRM